MRMRFARMSFQITRRSINRFVLLFIVIVFFFHNFLSSFLFFSFFLANVRTFRTITTCWVKREFRRITTGGHWFLVSKMEGKANFVSWEEKKEKKKGDRKTRLESRWKNWETDYKDSDEWLAHFTVLARNSRFVFSFSILSFLFLFYFFFFFDDFCLCLFFFGS